MSASYRSFVDPAFAECRDDYTDAEIVTLIFEIREARDNFLAGERDTGIWHAFARAVLVAVRRRMPFDQLAHAVIDWRNGFWRVAHGLDAASGYMVGMDGE